MLEPLSVEPAFDLGGFDLDLPGEGAQTLAEPETVTASAPAELSGAHMEMETKLDLAIAYQEIGDKEGARELLEEVIKGGSGEQVSRANAMRAQLA
jgi:pilus assembly protein FimV